MLANTHKIKTILITVLCTGLLFSAQLIAASRALPEFSASYAVQKYGIKLAEAHYQLSHTDAGYRFSHHTELTGFASMFSNDSVKAESLVDVIGDNLLLTKYSYVQTGRKKNRNEEFKILWNTYKNSLSGKITGVVRNKKINLKTNSEIWEALSFQIPLMIEADQNIKEYPYKALLKGKINTYNFVLKSTGQINFAGKQYKTLELVRTDPDRDRALHIWLIPELHNIPVIIENYRDGEEHSRMQLENIKFGSGEELTDQSIETEYDDDF